MAGNAGAPGTEKTLRAISIILLPCVTAVIAGVWLALLKLAMLLLSVEAAVN